MDRDAIVREQLIALLEGRQAHLDFETAIKDFPPPLRGHRVEGLPHTAWHLLEHIRRAQRDIIDFSRDPHYRAPNWPDDYWPSTDGPDSDEAWLRAVAAIRADALEMRALMTDPATDLYSPLPWGDGQNLLREAMLIADHNAFHLGQLITLRRLLGIWTD